jgi:hypothetical protein
LRKYKPEYQQQYLRITVTKLFESFMTQKAKEVTPKTMEKYQATLGYLMRFFRDAAAELVSNLSVDDFAQHLNGKGLSPIQCKRRLEELEACWNWAIAKNLIAPENPWTEVAKRIKVPPKQKPKPFSKEEIKAIVQAFRTDRYYSHYTDYAEFLGCVAKTGAELVKVVFILTALNHRHPIHESQVPVQMASLPILHHPVVRPVVSALSPGLPQSRRDDVGTGAHSRPYYGVLLGTGLCPPDKRCRTHLRATNDSAASG